MSNIFYSSEYFYLQAKNTEINKNRYTETGKNDFLELVLLHFLF